MGIDGVAGLDLKLKNFPFDFSLDWQPSINFGENDKNDIFNAFWGGLGIRYFIR